uniref:Uncharacterized protein n=1 Tax=viral metagenome TaxID=1070528 RepID=A0A6M3L8D9_9ZZZZ
MISFEQKELLKDRILELVNNGIKGTELVVKIISESDVLIHTDVVKVIEELMEQGEMIEIDYVLPSMEYRIKSFYLPKGTSISIEK